MLLIILCKKLESVAKNLQKNTLLDPEVEGLLHLILNLNSALMHSAKHA
jgi:hypothetical protein